MKNVLFISIDDLNDWTNGLKGYSGKVNTPNLDKLMDSGVTFSNAYSQVAICNPSRASVLTGKNPLNTQVFNNQTDWESTVDPAETIFGVMKANGYQSIGTGKLFHTGASDTAEEVMFDDYQYLGSDRTGINLDGKPVGAYNGKAPLTDENRAEYIASYLDEYTPEPDKPLFLSAGFLQPHTDWVVPQKYFDLYPLDSIEIDAVPNDAADIPQFALDNAGQTLPWSQDDVPDLLTWKKLIQGYLASISYMDDQVGKVVNALDSSAIADNTSVVLWSDHGYHLGDKDLWHKFTLWDNAAKAPLIIRDPDFNDPGKVIDDVVELTDIFPTVLDLTDVSTAGLELDGKSLVPKINNTEASVVENKAYTWMYGSVSLRTDGSEELYDVANDPELIVNLADKSTFAAVKNELNTNIFAEFNLVGYGSTETKLDGTDSNDVFAVNNNNQIANGGDGDDIYFLRGDTSIVEGESGGRDMIITEADKYILPDNVEVLEVQEISQEIHGNKSSNLIAANASIITSGLGDDTVRAGNRANKVFLGAGNDLLNSYGGKDTIYGGEGNDTIQFTGSDAQSVRGEAGDEKIILGWGNDTALGDDGNDSIEGGGNLDKLYGGSGNDTLEGNQDNDTLYGGWDNDLLDGGNGNDYLYAGNGNDTLYGAGGDDFIQGEWGNDIIYGGVGKDTLEGNQNQDIFVYTAASDSKIKQPDIITDFTIGEDKLKLDFLTLSTQIGSVISIDEANNYFAASSRQVAFSQAESTLYVDSSGQGTTSMAIELTDVSVLEPGDFI